IPFSADGPIVIGTDDLVAHVFSLMEGGMAVDDVAAAFHQAIIHTTGAVAERIRAVTGINDVALSGGVFHNRVLLEGIIGTLREKGFTVYTHKNVPCNDGCIALGQLAVAKYLLEPSH
ncbi:MAG TPA: carbamoyltransferase HypF, partial [Spirochaetota bacterium]|nr:carbamoyltransferase HypF [Spirochaetota bacterium]